MLLVNLRLFCSVVQDMHECSFVLFILRIQVAVAWNVDTVNLLKQGKSFFAVEVIVDRNDADPSLLKELNMRLGHVRDTARSLLAFVEQVTPQWLCEDANYRSQAVLHLLDRLDILERLVCRIKLWLVYP